MPGVGLAGNGSKKWVSSETEHHTKKDFQSQRWRTFLAHVMGYDEKIAFA